MKSSADRMLHRSTQKHQRKRTKLLNFSGSFRESLRREILTVTSRRCVIASVPSLLWLHLQRAASVLRHDGSPFHRLLVFIEMDFNHYSGGSLTLNQQTVVRCPLGSRSICFHTHPNLFIGTKSSREGVVFEGIGWNVSSTVWLKADTKAYRWQKCLHNIGDNNMVIM